MTPSRKRIPWHSLSRDTVIAALKTNPTSGLISKQIDERFLKFGKNVIEKQHRSRFVDICLSQLKNPLALILFFAGSATFILGKYLDTIVIFIALTINVFIGAVKKWRARTAFRRLAATQKKFSTVIRDGRKIEISADELVPGDVLVIEMGQTVGADARLIDAKDLLVNESLLSGEWLPISKDANKKIPREAPLAEQKTMV
ncbi:MAG: cation-transporting P-type ATPase, partial [Patescibacteria group bacterium]